MCNIYESVNCWRSIICCGRLNSTYKLALGFAIARLVERGKRYANISDLAEVFFELYLDRLNVDMPQRSNIKEPAAVENIIAEFKSGTLSREQAIRETEQNCFRYVLDAFHVLDGQEARVKFYSYDCSGLTLTDAAYHVFLSPEKDRVTQEMEYRWSAIEKAFARQRLGNNVFLWVASAGSGRCREFTWCHANASDGSLLATGTGIETFARGVSGDFRSRKKVCIGFEYPLCVVVSHKQPRLGVGLPGIADQSQFTIGHSESAISGLVRIAWVMKELRKSALDSVKPTFRWRKFVDGHANMFLWQATISNDWEIAPGINAAQAAAISFLNLYPRLCAPELAEGDAAFSLAAAVLMWAGFSLEENALRSPCIVVEVG